jgi:hypothetical protein
VNVETTPWNNRFDFKLDRRIDFSIGGFKSNFTVYFWVYNLFNAENIQNVWITSGLADNTGYLDTAAGKAYWANLTDAQKQAWTMREMDFNNYGIPRQMRLGVKWGF